MSKVLEFVVQVIAKSVLENEQYFSELDGVVGDADFGYSIARGFEKVLQEWDNMDHSLPGNFLKKVSSAIVSAVGGVSGTIWGTAFLRAGMVLGTKTEITRESGAGTNTGRPARAAIATLSKEPVTKPPGNWAQVKIMPPAAPIASVSTVRSIATLVEIGAFAMRTINAAPARHRQTLMASNAQFNLHESKTSAAPPGPVRCAPNRPRSWRQAYP